MCQWSLCYGDVLTVCANGLDVLRVCVSMVGGKEERAISGEVGRQQARKRAYELGLHCSE